MFKYFVFKKQELSFRNSCFIFAAVTIYVYRYDRMTVSIRIGCPLCRYCIDTDCIVPVLSNTCIKTFPALFFDRLMFNNILLQNQKCTLIYKNHYTNITQLKIYKEKCDVWKVIQICFVHNDCYLCEKNRTILCIVLYYKTENIRESVKYKKDYEFFLCIVLYMRKH